MKISVKSVAVVSFIIIFLVSAGIFFSNISKANSASTIEYEENTPVPASSTSPESPPEDASEPTVTPVSTIIPAPLPIETVILSFAGDCTVGDDEKYTWNTFDEIYDRVDDPSYFFSKVGNIFQHDDFTYINYEGTLTDAIRKAEKKYRFKGKPEYAKVLKSGSIEGVTLANNHSLDYLQQGYDDTVRILTENGISYSFFDTYFIKEIKGMKIGFLGYKGWSYEQESDDLLVKHVAEMRENGVDFIVASYHWGDEKSYYPNELQRRMAHFAIDNGVDLVIGHHPHVLQGMETYKEKTIVYSLGNFCFGGAPNPSDKDTIIYQHVISFNPNSKKIESEASGIIPVRVSGINNKNNYQPVIAQGKEAERILKKFDELGVPAKD